MWSPFLLDALAGLKTGSGQWLCCLQAGEMLTSSSLFQLEVPLGPG